MKIIINNSVEARFSFPMRVNCMSCKSVLEVQNRRDIQEMPADPREGPSSGYYYATCPVCNYKNAVKPSAIRQEATAEDYYNK